MIVRENIFYYTHNPKRAIPQHIMGGHMIKACVCVCVHAHVCWVASVMYNCLLPNGLLDCQAPVSMGFSRQECWSQLSCPLLGHLPNSGIIPESLMSPTLAGRFFITSATWEAPYDKSLR